MESNEFDEVVYLQLHDDVRKAVEGGKFSSGLDHYERDGLREGRATRSGASFRTRSARDMSPRLAAARHDLTLAHLKRELDERDRHIQALKDTLAGKTAELAALHASNSWRLMRPFRILRRLAGGGYRMPSKRLISNIFLTLQSELRRHGLQGFWRRLPFYVRNFRSQLPRLDSNAPSAHAAIFETVSVVPATVRLHPDMLASQSEISATVSIVIPTLNAGPEFALLLRKLRSQRGINAIEIVIVDSGSTDSTVQAARQMGCKVIEILPSEFSHSHARNLGADAATSEFLLFMVQDAYPIGNHWLYGMVCFLQEHADEKLVAASCAEFSRSDSDVMYDSMINTHYRFLGCLDYDRIGELCGDDHMSLRAFGQLSDVSCLIFRDLFSRYRYRGDYAEDLDLGVRLIKDGYRVAMLASVKVIHSHDRPAFYYLKRSLVDVVFLVKMFDDFVFHPAEIPRGLIAGIVSVAIHLSRWLTIPPDSSYSSTLGEQLQENIDDWRQRFMPVLIDEPSSLGDAKLDAYINSLASRFLHDEGFGKSAERFAPEVRRFLDAFLARLDHFNLFAGAVYGAQDANLRVSTRHAVLKTFAATAGSALGFLYLDQQNDKGLDADMSRTIKTELAAGI